LTAPAWNQAAPSSPSIVAGTAPRGAVESCGHCGCTVVFRIRSHLLPHAVGPHDGVGCEQPQQVREIPAAGCGEKRFDDPAAFGTGGLRCGRLWRSLHLTPCTARQLTYGGT
jgi:hypothetical protein